MEDIMHIFKQPGEGNRHIWARWAAEWTGQWETGLGIPLHHHGGKRIPRSRAARGLGANCHFRPGFPRKPVSPSNSAAWPGLQFIYHFRKVRWG